MTTIGTSRACLPRRPRSRSAGLQPAHAGQPLVQEDQRRLLGGEQAAAPTRRRARQVTPIPSPRNASASASASAASVVPSRTDLVPAGRQWQAHGRGRTRPCGPWAGNFRVRRQLYDLAFGGSEHVPSGEPGPPARPGACSTTRSSASSSRSGSWWDSASRLAPAWRHTATAYSTVLWPQPDLGRVLGGGVLRVVDHEVGARQELGVAPVLSPDRARRRSPARRA